MRLKTVQTAYTPVQVGEQQRVFYELNGKKVGGAVAYPGEYTVIGFVLWIWPQFLNMLQSFLQWFEQCVSAQFPETSFRDYIWLWATGAELPAPEAIAWFGLDWPTTFSAMLFVWSFFRIFQSAIKRFAELAAAKQNVFQTLLRYECAKSGETKPYSEASSQSFDPTDWSALAELVDDALLSQYNMWKSAGNYSCANVPKPRPLVRRRSSFRISDSIIFIANIALFTLSGSAS